MARRACDVPVCWPSTMLFWNLKYQITNSNKIAFSHSLIHSFETWFMILIVHLSLFELNFFFLISWFFYFWIIFFQFFFFWVVDFCWYQVQIGGKANPFWDCDRKEFNFNLFINFLQSFIQIFEILSEKRKRIRKEMGNKYKIWFIERELGELFLKSQMIELNRKKKKEKSKKKIRHFYFPLFFVHDIIWIKSKEIKRKKKKDKE